MSIGFIFYTPEEIEDLCSSLSVYKRGKSYWKNGNVTKLEYDPLGFHYEAIVQGSTKYNVTIGLGDNGKTYADCTCPAHDAYYGHCKHIAAVLLKIHELNNLEPKFRWKQNVSSMDKKEDKLTTQIIQVIDKYQTFDDPYSVHKQEFIEIEFTLKMKRVMYSETFLTLELRVGSQRLYVVRNIKNFLTSIANRQPYYFTAKFSYDPKDHHFTKQDEEIIAILLDMIKFEDFYAQSSNTYYNSLSADDRELLIPPLISDRLFMKLEGSQLIFISEGQSYTSLEWIEGIPPFNFQLNKFQADGFTLDLKELNSVKFLELYHYIFYNGTFYKVPEPQFKLLLEIKKGMTHQSQLYIQNSQIEQIISSVVPSLNKIGKVHISENISDRIINPPLQVKFFLDQENERLLARMEYHYDEVVIQPLQNQVLGQQNQNHILMREVEKENECMSLIESTPFKWNGNEMYLDSEEDIFTFLFEALPNLETMADIYMTSAVKNMLFNERTLPKTNIEINAATNLLDVRFEMQGIDEQEIHSLLQSVVEKKQYYRMADGRFVTLEQEEWQNIRELFEELDIKKSAIQGEMIQVPALRGLQLESIVKNSSLKIGKAFRQLLEHIKHPEDLDFPIPAMLENILRDYQKFGFQWLKTLAHYHFGGILADDMGLGKTLQAITFILSSKENQEQELPTLIVSPASLIYNWKKECEKFAPTLNVVVVSGDQSERMNLLGDLSQVDVFVTSYPLLRRDIQLYQEKQFSTLILDEAQAIKNDQTQQAHAVRKLKAGKRFALTGTPIENSIDELWSIFQVVLPGLFPGKQAFKQLPHEKISRMVQPFILRRMKKDVLTELPDKIETLQISELSKEQKKLYLGYLEKIQQETKKSLQSSGFQQNRMKILAGLTRLRQICCHPSLFIENYNDSSGKLEQLLEIVEDALESKRRLLIFSQFTSMLAIIRQEFGIRKIPYFYLDGKTDKQERVDMTEQFNQGEKDIFLISLKAGGTGLNLTGADTVILYDLWWNPAVDQQAVDRAHRLGQKNVVQVIRLITQGTIEEKIYELQQKKKELIDKVIQPGEAMISSLTEVEIRELLDI